MSIITKYKQYFKEHSIDLDEAQIEVLTRFAELDNCIKSKPNIFNKLLKKNAYTSQGIYLYGFVGRGKTMLMQAFYEFAATDKKRKIHFHTFMLEVHALIFELQKSGGSVKDPIAKVASIIKSKYDLICLDELQITDIADAMIVGRLFKELFNKGIYIVITSNRIPSDLYKNGLQREYFLEFIELIKNKLEVIELLSFTDYRLTKLIADEQRYYYPLNSENKRNIKEIINKLIEKNELSEKELEVNGRKLLLKNTYKDIAICDFNELCKANLGAADYLVIAKNFKFLFLLNIPKISESERNEAKRFTTLIDILYDHKVILFATSNVNISDLYNKGDGAFEFERTISRLIEMQSSSYT